MPPSPLKYAAASVKRPGLARVRPGAEVEVDTSTGNRSIVPTVSPVSVSACAHWPIRKLSAHSLAPEDLPEDQADHDAEEQRVREADARPAAMELHRIGRLQVPPPMWIP